MSHEQHKVGQKLWLQHRLGWMESMLEASSADYHTQPLLIIYHMNGSGRNSKIFSARNLALNDQMFQSCWFRSTYFSATFTILQASGQKSPSIPCCLIICWFAFWEVLSYTRHSDLKKKKLVRLHYRSSPKLLGVSDTLVTSFQWQLWIQHSIIVSGAVCNTLEDREMIWLCICLALQEWC